MIRLLIHAGISIVTAALAILVAQLLLSDFNVEISGFLIAVAVFAAAQSILAPVVYKIASKRAPAILGGIGLVSSFLALLIASLLPGGLQISGLSTWIAATLIVWVVTALGTWLIPLVVFKKLDANKEAKETAKRKGKPTS